MFLVHTSLNLDNIIALLEDDRIFLLGSQLKALAFLKLS